MTILNNYYLGDLPVTRLYLGDYIIWDGAWSGAERLTMLHECGVSVETTSQLIGAGLQIINIVYAVEIVPVEDAEATGVAAVAVLGDVDQVHGIDDDVDGSGVAYLIVNAACDRFDGIDTDVIGTGIAAVVRVVAHELDTEALVSTLTTGVAAEARNGVNWYAVTVNVTEQGTAVAARSVIGSAVRDIIVYAAYAATAVDADARIGAHRNGVTVIQRGQQTAVGAKARPASRYAHAEVSKAYQQTGVAGLAGLGSRNVHGQVVWRNESGALAMPVVEFTDGAALAIATDAITYSRAVLLLVPQVDLADRVSGNTEGTLQQFEAPAGRHEGAAHTEAEHDACAVPLATGNLDAADRLDEALLCGGSGIRLVSCSADLTERVEIAAECDLSDGFAEYRYEPPVWIGNVLYIRSVNQAEQDGAVVRIR